MIMMQIYVPRRSPVLPPVPRLDKLDVRGNLAGKSKTPFQTLMPNSIVELSITQGPMPVDPLTEANH